MKTTLHFIILNLTLLFVMGGQCECLAGNYVTKGNGNVVTFETLSQIEGSGVTKAEGAYHVTDDLVISATDTLRISDGDEVLLADKVCIKVCGYADFNVATNAKVNAVSDTDKPKGILLFGADATGVFRNIWIEKCGIRTEGITKGITIDKCTLRHYNEMLDPKGVVSINSNCDDNVISNSWFVYFETNVIYSESPAGVTVKDCVFMGGEKGDKTYSAINLCTGGDRKVNIEGNTVFIDKYPNVGGIVVRNTDGIEGKNEVTVRSNDVDYCSEGIRISGAVNVVVENNQLLSNKYATITSNGYGGIILIDSEGKLTANVMGNYIEGCKCGVYISGCKEVNLGTADKPGGNVFINNGHHGMVCDLYNNSRLTVNAQGNMWDVTEQTLEEIAKVVIDHDDDEALGKVVCDNAQTYPVRTEPHTLKATATFDKMTLSWKSPTAPIELKWHDGASKFVTSGNTKEQGLNDIIGAARFNTEDLAPYANKIIDAIEYYEGYDPFEAYVQIYENGTLVRNQKVNLAGFQPKTWRNAKLDEPYLIDGDKEIMVAVKIVYGGERYSMLAFDNGPTHKKGNLVSYDNGKTWTTFENGDVLVTAHIRNLSNTEPSGYELTADNDDLTSELITDTTFTIEHSADGEHSYFVRAIYKNGEVSLGRAARVNATTKAVTSYVPSPGYLQGYYDADSRSELVWKKPLQRGDEITWSNKHFVGSVGGERATSRVWIYHSFTANDLIAFPNHQISAINAYFTKAAPTSMKIFVLKNGKIDYFRDVNDEELAAVNIDGWTKFPLEEPYKFELGNDYGFGYYCILPTDKRIVGVDDSEGVWYKGNAVATTEPAENFEDSKFSGMPLNFYGYKGNTMLTADIEALGEVPPYEEIVGYDLYVNDEVVASDLTERSYLYTADEPGAFKFSVVAKSASGKVSPAVDCYMTLKLSEDHNPPYILSSNYDPKTRKVELEWTRGVARLMKCDERSTYNLSYDRDLEFSAGQMFTAEELKDLKDYEIYEIDYTMGASAEKLALEVYADSVCIFSEDITSLSPGFVSSLLLDEPVRIPEGKNIYIVYSMVCPKDAHVLPLDKGPYVPGGAVASLDHGKTWITLGEIDDEENLNNVYIKTKVRPCSTAREKENQMAEGTIANGVRRQPKVEKCIVYRNSVPVAETTGSNFSEVIDQYGEFTYTVSCVFANGWESGRSNSFLVENHIPQKPEAPYNLRGEVADGNLSLTWDAIDADAAVLKYHNGNATDSVGIGKYGCHYTIAISADSLAQMGKTGDLITHVKFYLASTDVTSCAAIVVVGSNVIRKQYVDVARLVKGWNVVRLDEPFVIKPEYADVKVGCFLKNALDIKPMAVDNGPAVVGRGDVYAEYTTYKSLATNYGKDANFMIEGIFQKGTKPVSAYAKGYGAEAPVITYNVYRNGEVVASGITGMNYWIASAAEGTYTVTATVDGVESAESNVFVYSGSTGISAVDAMPQPYYDRHADAVILPIAANAHIYTTNGALVKVMNSVARIDMSSFASGTYIVKTADAVIKVVK
ncbi:MAG: hypothetical protein ACI3YZ_10880 [Prevotella sp.]